MAEPGEKNVASCCDQHDESVLRQTDARLPLSIRVVAWVFVITGVSSLVNVVLQAFVIRRGLPLNFHVLGIFIGRGLLLRREGWLQFAWGYNALLLTIWAGVTILSVGFYVCQLAGFVGDTSVTWSGHPAFVLLSFLGVWAYLVWQQRVLSRPDVRDLFRRVANARPAQPARRFQFSLGTLLMLVVLAAVVLPQATDRDVLYERHVGWTVHTSRSAGRLWAVHSSYRSHRFLSVPDELSHVVFFSDKQQRSCQVTNRHSTRGDAEAILEMPDGTTIALDGDCQLIECIDGQYRESRERVTKAQFDAFLASKPAAYTIDALLEHAKKRP
jgi:hypothetical protein